MRNQHLFNVFIHLAFNIENLEMHPSSHADLSFLQSSKEKLF